MPPLSRDSTAPMVPACEGALDKVMAVAEAALTVRAAIPMKHAPHLQLRCAPS
jgi:hypothetical protein